MTPDQELVEAWQRILSDRAIRGDGAKAQLWLRRKLLAVPPINFPTCAVHDFEGQRRLAQELLSFAASADVEPDEHLESRADLDHERARRRAAGAEPQRPRGAARRVPG